MLRSIKITNDLNRSRSLQRRQLGVRLDLGMVLHLLDPTVVHWEQATVFPMLLFVHLSVGLLVTRTSEYLTQGLILSLLR